MKYSRVVAVLSGGGAKTAAHVGALKALEERQLVPGQYVGTSMGAVIAACFASGLDYDAVVKRIAVVRRRDVAVPAAGVVLGPFGKTVLRSAPLEETIARLVPARSFDDLRCPLTVTATDAETGELVLFGAGGRSDAQLHEALYASCALPMYYAPAVIQGRAYMDGGLRAVLPLRVAERLDPDLVYAVYAGPSLSERTPVRPERLRVLGAHDNSVRILIASQAAAEVGAWDGRVPLVLVRPVVDARATFAVENVIRYVEAGYRAGVAALEAWEKGG
ncbi:MAG: patatin-like phospholipase family protein [Gemmatimonadetes bacterium]|nr:patatin-like phospholipase family protein [Gemmatimonadota bacterium]